MLLSQNCMYRYYPGNVFIAQSGGEGGDSTENQQYNDAVMVVVKGSNGKRAPGDGANVNAILLL